MAQSIELCSQRWLFDPPTKYMKLIFFWEQLKIWEKIANLKQQKRKLCGRMPYPTLARSARIASVFKNRINLNKQYLTKAGKKTMKKLYSKNSFRFSEWIDIGRKNCGNRSSIFQFCFLKWSCMEFVYAVLMRICKIFLRNLKVRNSAFMFCRGFQCYIERFSNFSDEHTNIKTSSLFKFPSLLSHA